MSRRFVFGAVIGLFFKLAAACLIWANYELMKTQVAWEYMLIFASWDTWVRYFFVTSTVVLMGLVLQRHNIVRIGAGLGAIGLMVWTATLLLVPYDGGTHRAVSGLVPSMTLTIALYEILFIGVAANDWMDSLLPKWKMKWRLLQPFKWRS